MTLAKSLLLYGSMFILGWLLADYLKGFIHAGS